MKIFSWITKDTNINFFKPRKYTYALSIAMIIMSVFLMVFKGFNYGIDFSGGILIEVASDKVISLENVRKDLSALPLDDLTLQTIGEEGKELMIRAQTKESTEEAQREAIKQIKEKLGTEYEYRRIESVGPQVGDELKKAGVLASVIAILAICIYIWVRFEWQFALGALLGLFHDVIITVGLLSLFNMDISLTTVAAVLTLAGYSVNDTVVTYDRIRENLRKFKRMPQIDMLNKSINDIFSRTILTGLTTLLAAGALFVFGGDALRSFSFTIVWGIIIGTYSSIYISAIFLNVFDLKKAWEEKSNAANLNPFGNVD
jgi:preprotein translocase SecF subunit